MAFQPHSFMFQAAAHEDQDLHLSSTSLNTLPNPHHHFHGGGGGTAQFMMKRSLSFSNIHDNIISECGDQEAAAAALHGINGGIHGDDDLSDDGSQIGEKKKRLNLEQVKTLEKSFELGNKLEPERKMQLAKALGLQPRQIAIWFQNRRARWKTKQLEKDYEVLKKQFDALKSDNDSLLAQNKKLHAELSTLKSRDSNEASGLGNPKKENEGSWSNGSDNSCDINLEISRTPVISSPASSQINGKNTLFPSSNLRPTSITQFLQGSSRSEIQGLNKVDHHHNHHHHHHHHNHQMVQEESFCNMFNSGIEEQQGFWPWPEQHQFH